MFLFYLLTHVIDAIATCRWKSHTCRKFYISQGLPMIQI